MIISFFIIIIIIIFFLLFTAFTTICSAQIVFLSSKTLSSGEFKNGTWLLCFGSANNKREKKKKRLNSKRSAAFVQHSKALNLIFRMKIHEKSFGRYRAVKTRRLKTRIHIYYSIPTSFVFHCNDRTFVTLFISR